MVTQELLDNVAQRYRQGQNKSQIKEALIAEGWEDIDIDQAVLHWQRAGLAQIPLVAQLIDGITRLDQRTAKLPPAMVVGALSFCVIFLVVVAGILYFVLDPFGMRAIERDEQRETVLVLLQKAIGEYYSAKRSYPSSLRELAPNYLSHIPVDPKTQKEYEYILDPSEAVYKLCAVHETKKMQCLSNLQN